MALNLFSSNITFYDDIHASASYARIYIHIDHEILMKKKNQFNELHLFFRLIGIFLWIIHMLMRRHTLTTDFAAATDSQWPLVKLRSVCCLYQTPKLQVDLME